MIQTQGSGVLPQDGKGEEVLKPAQRAQPRMSDQG
jgi:hypothetical protein